MSIAALFTAGCLAAAGPVVAGGNPYQTKSMTPEHRHALQQSIAQCVQQVNSSKDLEARARHQEELCKRLVLAEDYDNALRVAKAIHETRGIDAERRAAHHYMIAQIHAMKMKASPTTRLMEQNRRLAFEAAREVLGVRYDSRWGITQAAETLLQELQNPQHMQKIVAAVKTREMEASQPASRPMHAETVNTGRGSVRVDTVAQAAVEPAPAATEAAEATGAGSAATVGAVSDSVRRVYAARNDSSVLRSPIMIDGATIRPAEPMPEETQ